MTMFRFHFDGARITFVCRPRDALIHAARFSRSLRRELLAISELRRLDYRPQLTLI